MRDSAPLDDWDGAVERLRRTFPGLPAKTSADWLAIARATYREGDDGRIHQDWDPAVLRSLLAGLKEGPIDLWPRFRALGRVRVLVLRGETSTVLSRDTLVRMAAAHPRLAEVTVPGVGHAPSLEARTALDDFLAKIP